jgi:hypothetical protein
MLDLTVPGFGRLELTDLVCDYNGTLAADGLLVDGVHERIQRMGAELLEPAAASKAAGGNIARVGKTRAGRSCCGKGFACLGVEFSR